ncbi:hypothetical protein O6H91_01G166500 [Diphasiastrum complanatum]|uniref:Uncharacterized protein n=1 Tax=Diphasiastrum complanatum TaxID=34168 RepID=A0ACC2EZ12_DIPCM|nr:hypothetical protein O6H91_01G166500 [Diphasiastrum complanatum]
MHCYWSLVFFFHIGQQFYKCGHRNLYRVCLSQLTKKKASAGSRGFSLHGLNFWKQVVMVEQVLLSSRIGRPLSSLSETAWVLFTTDPPSQSSKQQWNEALLQNSRNDNQCSTGIQASKIHCNSDLLQQQLSDLIQHDCKRISHRCLASIYFRFLPSPFPLIRELHVRFIHQIQLHGKLSVD